MDESRVRIFSQSPKKYNIMKISPPIDLKIQSWIKPIMYNDVKASDTVTVNTAYSLKRRKTMNLLNRSIKPNSPLILCESSSAGKNNNKFIGRKELFNQNSNYYILGKNDLGYEAFPVFDWYHFSRGVNFRYCQVLNSYLYSINVLLHVCVKLYTKFVFYLGLLLNSKYQEYLKIMEQMLLVNCQNEKLLARFACSRCADYEHFVSVLRPLASL